MRNIDFRLKCWYEAGCNLKTDFCEKTCHRYLQMNYLIQPIEKKDFLDEIYLIQIRNKTQN